ncbi:hypothetical protein CJF31_00001752 [Rutstroemia sp. NJR-2017a BVV2]|nr:hypothetical protein CJF31_00001752 [Rutstroemia sp. NJR-2017a BVV2]
MPNATRDYGDLRVTMTTSLKWAWDNWNYESNRSCCFWNPEHQGNIRPLGSTNWRAVMLFGPKTNSTNPNLAVKRPTDYTRTWWESNDHSWHMDSVWRPTAPAGYVALGDVMVNSVYKPSLDQIWCLRADLVKPAAFWPSSIWDDRGSGNSQDISIWAAVPEPMSINGSENIPVFADTFIHSANYGPPDNDVTFVPILPLGNQFKDFDQAVPSFSRTSFPSTGKLFTVVEQAAVTLPLRCFFWSEDSRCVSQIANLFMGISKGIAWYAEGVWENGGNGTFAREKRIKYGISKTQTESMEQQVGITITASHGFKLAEMSVSLKYQFTHMSSTSFTGFTETEVTEKSDVPPKTCTVLLSKHVFMKATMNNGGTVMNQIEAVANDDVHFGGCTL